MHATKIISVIIGVNGIPKFEHKVKYCNLKNLFDFLFNIPWMQF